MSLIAGGPPSFVCTSLSSKSFFSYFRSWRGVWDLRRPGRAAWVLAYFLILHDTFGPDMTLSNMKFWPATCNILIRPVFLAGFTLLYPVFQNWLTHCYDTLITNNHAVLSTLPDNPGDSRRSPGLQIRVSQFLLKNRQLAKLLFFYTLNFPTMKFQIFCVVWAIAGTFPHKFWYATVI